MDLFAKFLEQISGQELVARSTVVDMLLDIRNARIVPDEMVDTKLAALPGKNLCASGDVAAILFDLQEVAATSSHA